MQAGLLGHQPQHAALGAVRQHPQRPVRAVAHISNALAQIAQQLLFTDHLLAVELAGTLLLIATVGAIAIAGTRRERPA